MYEAERDDKNAKKIRVAHETHERPQEGFLRPLRS
jgi:hypothetical protein